MLRTLTSVLSRRERKEAPGSDTSRFRFCKSVLFIHNPRHALAQISRPQSVENILTGGPSHSNRDDIGQRHGWFTGSLAHRARHIGNPAKLLDMLPVRS